jgi:hypothetical protein
MPLMENGSRYVIIPLLGRFKTKDGEQYHLTPLAFQTNSGIKIGTWVQRLVEVKAMHRQLHGPAFSDRRGKVLSSHWLEMEILDRLQEIQNRDNDLIPKEVNVHEEYGLARSFWRGATTQARNAGMAENDIKATSQGPRCKTTTQTSAKWFQPYCDFLKPFRVQGAGGEDCSYILLW